MFTNLALQNKLDGILYIEEGEIQSQTQELKKELMLGQ
jgi:hypothetical protein